MSQRRKNTILSFILKNKNRELNSIIPTAINGMLLCFASKIASSENFENHELFRFSEKQQEDAALKWLYGQWTLQYNRITSFY